MAEHGGEDEPRGRRGGARRGRGAARRRARPRREAAEAALATARETERRARGPYEAAERNLGALQAEARTLAELLDLEKTEALSRR